MFILRIPVKLPEPLRVHPKSHQISEGCRFQRVLSYRYNGSVGRCAQARQWGWMQGRWPEKSAEFLLHRLKNAESSAELKGLDVDSLLVEHIQESKASRRQRRMYRAHGRMKTLPLKMSRLLPNPKKLKKQKLIPREYIQHKINANKSFLKSCIRWQLRA